MTFPAILILTSATIIALLGIGHLILTYHGPKLLPRDLAVRTLMQKVHPGITTQTTMWRAWIGFNASHSLGAILFGVLYGYLAVVHAPLLFSSIFLQMVGLITLVAYLLMSIAYWFISPLIGVTLSLLCFVGGLILVATSGA